MQYVLLGSPDGQSVCYDIQHKAGSAPSLSSAGYLVELVMLAPCGRLAVDQARAERHEAEQGIELSTGLAIATIWQIGVMVDFRTSA